MPDVVTIVEGAIRRIAALRIERPHVALVLGSGLGHVADAVRNPVCLPAGDIPAYPKSTVEGHEGAFVFGRLNGVPVAVLKGRIHLYEGHSPQIAALPARILCALRPALLILTNAAGGLNRDFKAGDLMLITDHLNLTGRSPLEGPNIDPWGPRFPDLTAVYPAAPRNVLHRQAGKLGLELRQGIYACLPGPQYETPAEIRMLRILGADAVGMSTVPEAIVAAHMKVPVLGISLISNLAAGLSGTPLSHDEVLAAAETTGETLGQLLVRALPDLAGTP
jgi:purine-nucleoside phosphorylase